MENIIDGVLRFQREVHPEKAELFAGLAEGQAPSALFIGCADSRVVPEVLTQQGPGSLFVVRNAGNIVPPSSTVPGGVTASIEYAVAVLEVPDIVICGHSGCGAMGAFLRSAEEMEKLPAVSRWLHYADAAREAVEQMGPELTGPERLNALVRQNVLAQLANLVTHLVVAEAIGRQKLRLHGWVYDIATGGVDTYDVRKQAFVPLGADAGVSATRV